MSENLGRIKKIGFTLAGCWKLTDNGLVVELNDNELAKAQNVLYVFVVDDEVMYVGAGRQLGSRTEACVEWRSEGIV